MDVLEGLVSEETLELVERAAKGELPKPSKIAELREGQMNVFLKAKVATVYIRKSYDNGSYRRIELEDETGKIKLVLFNEQAEHAKRVLAGDVLAITNAYVEGGELHLSPLSKISVESSAKVLSPAELSSEGRVNVQGTVVEEAKNLYLEEGGVAVRLEGKPLHTLKGKKVVLSYALFKDASLTIDGKTRIFIKQG